MLNLETLRQKHESFKRSAGRQGVTDGAENLPVSTQTTYGSSEQLIVAEYQQLIVLLDPEAKQLNEIKAQYRTAVQALREIESNPTLIDDRIASKKRGLENELQQLNTTHESEAEKYATHPSYVESRREHREAQEEFEKLQIQLKRSSPKPNRWELWRVGNYDWGCYLIILVMCVAEFPINMKVFELFGENRFMTMLMACVLIFIPVSAHFAGLNVKRTKESKTNTIVVTVLIMIFFLFLAFMRYEFLLKENQNPDKVLSISMFFLLNVLIYLVAAWISYATNDEDKAFEDLYDRYVKASKDFSWKSNRLAALRGDLLNQRNEKQEEVRKRIHQEIEVIRASPNALHSQINQFTSAFHSKRDLIESHQTMIKAQCVESLNKYRKENSAHRTKPQPAYWNAPIHVPNLDFLTLPTLES